jgi:hypothetical protein
VRATVRNDSPAICHDWVRVFTGLPRMKLVLRNG